MIQSHSKRNRQYSRLLLIAGMSALCWQSSARAQVAITSSNPAVLTATQGQTVSLSAMLQNMFSTSVYFLGDNISFTSAAGPTEFGSPTSSLTVALDDTPFAGTPSNPSFPAPLAAGEQRTLPLANLFVGQSATVGTYTGTFTVQGNTAPNGAANDLVTQNFQLTVGPAAIPETSTLLSLGLLMTFGAWKFRRVRCKPA